MSLLFIVLSNQCAISSLRSENRQLPNELPHACCTKELTGYVHKELKSDPSNGLGFVLPAFRSQSVSSYTVSLVAPFENLKDDTFGYFSVHILRLFFYVVLSFFLPKCFCKNLQTEIHFNFH